MGAAYRRILSFFLALCLLAGPAGFSVLASEKIPSALTGDDEEWERTDSEQEDADEERDDADPASDPEQDASASEDTVVSDAAQSESPGMTEPALGASGMLAASSPAVRTASTAEELSRLLEEDMGGTIQAACDLYLTGDGFGGTAAKPVTVDMGPYTLFVEGSILSLGGSVHLTGSGTVVDLRDARFSVGKDVSIGAVGDNAIAVRIHEDVEWLSTFSQITTDGAGSVGIDVQAEHYVLETTFVDARGAGSVGIQGAGAIELFLCAVTAEGDAVVSDSGEITLDSSNVSPVPVGATERMRTAVPWEELMEYWTFVGEPIDYFDAAPSSIYDFYLDPGDPEEEPVWAQIPISWNLEDVDYDTPGEYTVTTTVLPEISRRFPMMDFPPAKGSLTVLDETTIFIDYISCVRDGEYYYTVEIELTSPLGEYDDFLLYYCRKGTTDWEMVDETHIEVIENYIFVERLFTVQDIGSTFECQLLIFGEHMIYETNIHEVTIGDENGGDRNNTDRDPDPGDPLPGDNSGDQDGEDGNQTPTPTPPEDQGSGGSIGKGTSGAGGSSGRGAGADRNVSPAVETTDTPESTPPPTGQADQNGSPIQPVYGPVTVDQRQVQTLEQPLPRGAVLIYTAQDLADLADANPEGVTFISGRMRLRIPTAALASVELGDGELFQVDMGMAAPHQFHFRLYAGAREITSFTGTTFTVQLPASFAADLDGELLCSGEEIDGLPVEREDNAITVHLDQTGAYRLYQNEAAVMAVSDPPAADIVSMDTPEPVEAADGAPVWPFAACGVLALGVGGWFLWRRHIAGVAS